MLNTVDTIRAIQWRDHELLLLDQRKLPLQESYFVCRTLQDAIDAIRDMVVRGAPAIGITAAYAVVLAVSQGFRQHGTSWQDYIEEDLQSLAAARPTAVNLGWAVNTMRAYLQEADGSDPSTGVLALARRIHDDDVEANREMGRLGAELIEQGGSVLTHCNTGSLATGGFGTALGVIRSAYAQGKIARVYADETRPWLQGSRLTAWELLRDNIPVALIADAAAAHLMRQQHISWVIVGADRIAANGDVANKIGTYSAAIAARYHNVRFMVVAPTTTIDMSLDSGSQIPIETRAASELLQFNGNPFAAPGSDAWNPVFDITPAALIDAIVTEKGVVHRPDRDGMLKLFG